MTAANRPNLVYILADDMGYGDVRCLNPESKIHTAALDHMAAGGMVFRDAHASSAVCTPSRYSILTGRYNWRSTLKDRVLFGYDGALVEPGRMTVASLLRQQGYRTACVGKWHLGWNWAKHSDDPKDIDFTRPVTGGPTDVGFDEFFGIIGSLDMDPCVYVEGNMPQAVPEESFDGDDDPKTIRRTGPIASGFDFDDVLPAFTRRAVETIHRLGRGDEPFFLYLPLTAPHTPILPSEQFRGKSGTNEYGDFCLQVDDIVSQVTAALEATGQADNTILIFTSDNGCSPNVDFEELAAVGHHPSYHFRGHKADIYEGGHRIPLLIRWPERIAPGSVCDETTCLVDLLATMAEILGADVPDEAGEDSVSNLPLWTGQSMDDSLREATVHHSIDGSFSIRRGRWKLEMCPGSGGWSYPQPGPECEGLPPMQLYDLQADVGERVNRLAEHPEVIEELTALLTRYVEQGRSTPGSPQPNTGGPWWPQLWWMDRPAR
jgi:arylsulfatase A